MADGRAVGVHDDRAEGGSSYVYHGQSCGAIFAMSNTTRSEEWGVHVGGKMLKSLDTLKVSVVIPTFSRAPVIANAVHSVLEQTFQDLEIIVVDDGSRDATAETVLRLARTDPRIRLIRHQSNRGA